MTSYTRVGDIIAHGSNSRIYKATGEPSGMVIAYKKSRISLRVKRTMLRHEARVMQLLQGHPAIPRLVGYHRGKYFEYMGMELLGMELKATVQDKSALRPGTVARVGEQILAVLEHLYLHKIIHRDIKGSNILLCLSDPSRIRLADFGLARYLGADMDSAPKKLYEENYIIIGTTDWCSQNVHAGIELRAQDDLESLGYTLFFLLLGTVPWRFDYPMTSEGRATKMIQASKRNFTDTLPFPDIPIEFSALLLLARVPVNDWAASLALQRKTLHDLAVSLGEEDGTPLDWTPVPAILSAVEHNDIAPDSEEGLGSNLGDSNEEYSDSLDMFDADMVYWDIHGGRDRSLSFPVADAEYLDGQIPELGRIVDPSWGADDI